MGYYNYLCELLRPLRVYRLDEGSLSGAEPVSYTHLTLPTKLEV